jgi:hypothetical protein
MNSFTASRRCAHRHLLLCGLFLFVAASSCFGQDGAKVRTTLLVKEKVWIGERVTLVIELLSPGYFAGSPTFDLPRVQGVLILQPDDRPVLGSEVFEKKSFTVQRHEFAVFPELAGRITIPPFMVRFTTRQGVAEPVEHSLPTDAASFEANVPPGAEGLATLISAHDLKATETWLPVPGAAKAGDAFTRTITFSSSDVPSMAFPPFPATEIPGLGVYPKAPKLFDDSQRGVTRGQRQDTFTYVCQRPGHFVVPAARFTWWDLDHHQLRNVDFPARAFEVAANPALPAPAAVSRPDGSRNLRAQVVLVGFVATIIAVLGGITFWTRQRWPMWWRAIAFWRPVHLAPLNPGDSLK